MAEVYGRKTGDRLRATSGRISTDLLEQFGERIAPAGEGPEYFLRNDWASSGLTDIHHQGFAPDGRMFIMETMERKQRWPSRPAARLRA